MKEVESGHPAVSVGAAKDPLPGPIPRLWAAAVCILTFLAYLPTLRFQYVHDDRGIILGNPAVHSWRAVPSYFTSQVWAAVSLADLGHIYRPIYLLWYRINSAIFGDHPAGWHFSTIIIHVVATYCVFLLAHRIFREWPAALFSGLVFGLHPVHIEAVAWISGGPDAMITGLMIPAYLCWARSREAEVRRSLWLGVSLVLYAMAMLVKEPAVMLPLILFASQWMDFPRPLEPAPRGRMQKAWQITRALLPYFVLTAVYLVARTLALKGFSHPISQISWGTVALTLPSLLLFYIKLLIWPVGLSPFYGLLYVTHPTLGNTILPGLALLIVAGGLWKWASRSRPVSLAIPWLIFPVLPVLDIQVFGNGNFAHNRYVYLPSVGFALLVAAALKYIKSGRPYPYALRSSQLLICLGLATIMVVTIQWEDVYYANDAAFYSYAYSRMKIPDPVIVMDYANTLAEEGDFGHAAAIYQSLIQANPYMWNAYFNFGYMYYQEGQLEPAVLNLSRAAAGDPMNPGAFFYLGLADLKLNRVDEAEANLRRAVALSPGASGYHFALGIVLKLKGNLPGALDEFNKEIELNPQVKGAAQQAAEIQRQLAAK